MDLGELIMTGVSPKGARHEKNLYSHLWVAVGNVITYRFYISWKGFTTVVNRLRY